MFTIIYPLFLIRYRYVYCGLSGRFTENIVISEKLSDNLQQLYNYFCSEYLQLVDDDDLKNFSEHKLRLTIIITKMRNEVTPDSQKILDEIYHKIIVTKDKIDLVQAFHGNLINTKIYNALKC